MLRWNEALDQEFSSDTSGDGDEDDEDDDHRDSNDEDQSDRDYDNSRTHRASSTPSKGKDGSLSIF